MMAGKTVWGRVVEQTSFIFPFRIRLTYLRKCSSLSLLYTSIQPQREPGQGSSLEMPRMEMAGTSPITSQIGTVVSPL